MYGQRGCSVHSSARLVEWISAWCIMQPIVYIFSGDLYQPQHEGIPSNDRSHKSCIEMLGN
jgi:hypothetical protein